MTGFCTARSQSDPAILAMAEENKRLREALEKIAGASVAFNAHPVGVIETMREWAREGLGLRSGERER